MYDQQITIDYALNLFQGKLIPSEPVKQLKPIDLPVLPKRIDTLCQQLSLSIQSLSVIATMHPDKLEELLDLMWSFSGIKSVLAARAVQDYRDVLSLLSSNPIKFPPQAVRSLLRRLEVAEPLKEYYRYAAISAINS